jgi:hypothetical protein
MTAFTNRKYPVLDVIEVGVTYESNKSVKTVGDVLELNEDSMRILVKPVYVMSPGAESKKNLEGRRPIAIAAVLQHIDGNASTSASISAPLSMIPVEGRGVGAGSFATDPSLGDLSRWANGVARAAGFHSHVGLFFPLSVHAMGIDLKSIKENDADSACAAADVVANERAGLFAAARALRKTMRTCCAKNKITGIRLDVRFR